MTQPIMKILCYYKVIKRLAFAALQCTVRIVGISSGCVRPQKILEKSSTNINACIKFKLHLILKLSNIWLFASMFLSTKNYFHVYTADDRF